MVSEARKQSMAWMETDYAKHTYFRWKIKWRLEHLGALGTMGDTARHLEDKGSAEAVKIGKYHKFNHASRQDIERS